MTLQPDRQELLKSRTIALVGLMGAGKTTIGRRLAKTLDIPFVDADAEIEAAAGCTINDIFESHGEAEFRRGEHRVIARLLTSPPIVLATGGGAFMNTETRSLIQQTAISIWLRANLDILMKRVSKRGARPLLRRNNPREIMEKLIKERYPIYAQADIIVDNVDGPHEMMIKTIIDSLDELYKARTS